MNRKNLTTVYYGLFSVLNAGGAAVALQQRKYPMAALRVVFAGLMASYAAQSATVLRTETPIELPAESEHLGTLALAFPALYPTACY